MFNIFLLVLFFTIEYEAFPFHPPSIDGRIVGGVDTTIEEIPYQISLQYWGSHACGGAILNENTILTAAHCFDVWDFDQYHSVYTVRVGSTIVTNGALYNVDNIIIHPGFVKATYDFDVAIVKLTSNLTFSSTIQPIEMVAKDTPLPYGEKATVSGWGRLYYQGPLPTILQKLDIEVFPSETCANIYESINTMTDRMFCAGYLEGGKDSCHGDSGGPLVHNNQLIGVVSWGIECALPNYPGVYANIANLRPWIDANI